MPPRIQARRRAFDSLGIAPGRVRSAFDSREAPWPGRRPPSCFDEDDRVAAVRRAFDPLLPRGDAHAAPASALDRRAGLDAPVEVFASVFDELD